MLPDLTSHFKRWDRRFSSDRSEICIHAGTVSRIRKEILLAERRSSFLFFTRVPDACSQWKFWLRGSESIQQVQPNVTAMVGIVSVNIASCPLHEGGILRQRVVARRKTNKLVRDACQFPFLACEKSRESTAPCYWLSGVAEVVPGCKITVTTAVSALKGRRKRHNCWHRCWVYPADCWYLRKGSWFQDERRWVLSCHCSWWWMHFWHPQFTYILCVSCMGIYPSVRLRRVS